MIKKKFIIGQKQQHVNPKIIIHLHQKRTQQIINNASKKNPYKVCGKRHSYNSIFHNHHNGILISLKV